VAPFIAITVYIDSDARQTYCISRCVSCVKSVTWHRQPHSRCWCRFGPQRAGWPAGLPATSAPVGLERSRPSGLSSESRDHITDALISIHWLRAIERMLCKMAVLTYVALHGWSMSLTCPVDQHSALPDRTVNGFRRSNCQPSAVDRVRSQQHSAGTGCPTMLRNTLFQLSLPDIIK